MAETIATLAKKWADLIGGDALTLEADLESQELGSLKLNDMKSITRHYIEQEYHNKKHFPYLALSKNKPEMELNLLKLAMELVGSDQKVPCGTVNAQPKARSPSKREAAQIHPPIYRPPASGRSQAQIHKHMTILNSQRKRNAFASMAKIEGLDEDEILEAISRVDNTAEALDPDKLIMAIMIRREEEEAEEAEEEEERKRQEDSDMDLAILNSEGERDVIQDRKRRRVESLKCDCCCDLLEAEEFSHSLLLPRNSCAGSGSEIMAELCRALDRKSCLKMTLDPVRGTLKSSDTCTCPRDVVRMRLLVVRLLLLEVDSIKYHKEACEGYLRALAGRIDELRGADKSDVCYEKPSSTLRAQPSPAVRGANHGFCCGVQYDDIVACLEKEIDALELCLYQPPKDGGQIPIAFRRLAGDRAMVSAFSLEGDGFEMVNIPENVPSAADEAEPAAADEPAESENGGDYYSDEEAFPW